MKIQANYDWNEEAKFPGATLILETTHKKINNTKREKKVTRKN